MRGASTRGLFTSESKNKLHRGLVALLLISAAVFADEGPVAPLLGQPVSVIVDRYRTQGHPFAYSTSLLGRDLLVEEEPVPGEPFDVVEQILKPHGLTLRIEAGVWLIVPLNSSGTAAGRTPVPELSGNEQALENVIVSASRYAISRDVSTSRVLIDQRTIQSLPDIGEDPVRATHHLPGAAASGASAIAHFRGGEQGEVGIMLNGQWLFDPYHIRDYQNVFSAIDARAIDGVEIFTGGFPVRYGDRMSGMVLMDSLDPEKRRHSEIGLSVFNTSFLTTGRSDRSHWLLSGRRGNLDLVIDPRYGKPSYFDLFGEGVLAINVCNPFLSERVIR